jgi:hypothetical protein
MNLGREIRVEFVNESGKWETLVEASLEYLRLYKHRTIAGKSRVGLAASFRAIAADSGEVLDIWQSNVRQIDLRHGESQMVCCSNLYGAQAMITVKLLIL